jgi:hypothetical protein
MERKKAKDVYDKLDIRKIQENDKAMEYLQKLKKIDLDKLSDQEIDIILENIFLLI